MQEMDPVRVIVEKEKYAKKAFTKGCTDGFVTRAVQKMAG